MVEYPFQVKIGWTTEQGTIWWNETVALVLEVFGLPGHRFIYKPSIDHMEFRFKTNKDLMLARILLADRNIDSA